MFETEINPTFLSRFDLKWGRILFIAASTISIIIYSLVLITWPTDGFAREIASAVAMLALVTNSSLFFVGIFICFLVWLRRMPLRFWIMATIYALLPVIHAVLLS